MNDKTQIMKRSSDEQLEIAIQALWRIAPTRQCEVFRSGIGSCFKAGRTVNAEDEADRCCDSCIAHDALDRMGDGVITATASSSPLALGIGRKPE